MDFEQDKRRAIRPLLLFLLAFTSLNIFLALLLWPVTARPLPALTPAEATTTGPIYGVNFISSAELPASPQRYQNGLATGATWNRWPIYWFFVETAPGTYNWAAQDANVLANLEQGLYINAILLGTPSFYTTLLHAPQETTLPRPGRLALYGLQKATPSGLYQPIFDDGTDEPGPGKQINPANVWAIFVYTAVNRYKPDGLLAQVHNWPPGVGITHWEMWNEPDLDFFWDASLEDYARLLKVGYLAAKQADPEAQMLFGALANNHLKPDYYQHVLDHLAADPLAAGYGYFHDVLATHNYFYAWRSWYHVDRARQVMQVHGLDKPVWLNESGVPAWDDYPGPTWEPTSGLRATMQESADHAIQNAFYAVYAGAEAIFHFALYDDCGNQPSGTDFPPHNGELCDDNGRLIDDPDVPCAGDAYGLFRNPPGSICYGQHPQPETPRPNFTAFQLLTGEFTGVEPLWWHRLGNDDPVEGPQEWIAFYKPATGERIVGLWARFGQPETAVVPATGSSARLLTPDGASQTITPTHGVYTLTLPAASNRNAFWDPNLYAIGGRPFILIEQDTLPPDVAAGTALIFTAGITDTVTIALQWQADDGLGSGIDSYDVEVSIGGAPFTPWLTQTTAVSATYQAHTDQTYAFRITARDRAGNEHSIIITRYVPLLTEHVYLPVVNRE